MFPTPLHPKSYSFELNLTPNIYNIDFHILARMLPKALFVLHPAGKSCCIDVASWPRYGLVFSPPVIPGVLLVHGLRSISLRALRQRFERALMFTFSPSHTKYNKFAVRCASHLPEKCISSIVTLFLRWKITAKVCTANSAMWVNSCRYWLALCHGNWNNQMVNVVQVFYFVKNFPCSGNGFHLTDRSHWFRCNSGRHTWRWRASPCRRTPINSNFPGTQNWNTVVYGQWLTADAWMRKYRRTRCLTLSHLSHTNLPSYPLPFSQSNLPDVDAKRYAVAREYQSNQIITNIPFFRSSFHPVGSLGQFSISSRTTIST